MTPAHVHLVLNHVPVLGAVFGLLVLCGGLAWQRHDVVRTALGLFVLAALAAIPTYASGEGAEEQLEPVAGNIEPWVEPHEEAALVSLVLVEAVGLLSLVALWAHRRQPEVRRTTVIAIGLLALVAAGLLGWTASLGGQVRHTEIRTGAPTTAVPHEDSVPHQEP